jgi:ribonuclease J
MPDRVIRDELVFLPLGGCGEIGMNLYLYGVGPAPDRTWLMVDLGIKFGDERDPGVDVILPDTAFIEAERANLAGIVLTHAHEDHFGAVAHLWPRLKVPVYATPFTAHLLRRKLAEAGLLETVPIEEIGLGTRLDIGPFNVEFVSVTHSIPEPNALVLRTSCGTVVHSGDWKIDPTPVVGPLMREDRLREIGAEGCRAFICDSTNVLRGGISPSEGDVGEELLAVIAEAPNRVAVTSFASNVARIASIARATAAAGRHLVVVGRALHNIIEAARETGYLDDTIEVLDQDAYGYLPRDKVVCLCTGSQGERRAALSRIAEGSHPMVAFEAGDTVVYSSRTIPGNEKAVSRIHNLLAAAGVDVVTVDERPVHVTGHPRRGELEEIYKWLRPELLVPMHGEARHLHEHAKFARACGIPEAVMVNDGDMVRLAPGPAMIVDEVPVGRLHIDGTLIVSEADGVSRGRRKLSFSGLVAVSLVVSAKGRVVGEPLVDLFGIPETDGDGVAMRERVHDLIDEVFDTAPKARRRDREFLEEVLYRGVRRTVEERWGRKPVCTVFVHGQD